MHECISVKNKLNCYVFIRTKMFKRLTIFLEFCCRYDLKLVTGLRVIQSCLLPYPNSELANQKLYLLTWYPTISSHWPQVQVQVQVHFICTYIQHNRTQIRNKPIRIEALSTNLMSYEIKSLAWFGPNQDSLEINDKFCTLELIPKQNFTKLPSNLKQENVDETCNFREIYEENLS